MNNTKSKIQLIFSKFRFDFIGEIELKPEMRIMSISGDAPILYFSDAKGFENRFYTDANIKVFNTESGKFEQDICKMKGTSAIYVYKNKFNNEIIYSGKKNGMPKLFVISLKNRSVVEFTETFTGNRTCYFPIRSQANGLFFVDPMHHVLRKYSHSGILESEFNTWKEGYVFPQTIEVYDQQHLFISFGQAETSAFFPEFRKDVILKPNRFALWNHVKNYLYPFNFDFDKSRIISFSTKTDSGMFFFSNGENLIKTDSQLKIIFDININILLREKIKNIPTHEKITNLYIYYNDGKLYIADFKTESMSSVYMFNV